VETRFLLGEDLAKFGYRSERKLDFFCLDSCYNLATCWNLLSKSCGLFFFLINNFNFIIL